MSLGIFYFYICNFIIVLNVVWLEKFLIISIFLELNNFPFIQHMTKHCEISMDNISRGIEICII